MYIQVYVMCCGLSAAAILSPFSKTGLARVTTCRTLPFGGRIHLGSVRML